jgi:pheromone shutdown-related protein TraB
MSESATVSAPVKTVRLGDTEIVLLGTAHVSRASAEDVRRHLTAGEFDAVAVELCPSRHQAMSDPDQLARMDLFQVLKQGKAGMVAASLALGAYQQRLAEQFGIEPGAEMRAAIAGAKEAGVPLLVIDREVGVTLKRIYRRVGIFQRLTLISGLAASVISRDKIDEAEIERLKEGDMLESTFAEFAERSGMLYDTLIAERDRYMAAKLQQECAGGRFRRVLVVIGAGHLAGLAAHLEQPMAAPAEVAAELERVPEPSRWPKLLPWVVVGLIIAGFVYGFSQSQSLGWQLVLDWVLINGTLCALGSLIALAHPLTVIASFFAAPITSLNPTIGAGFVAASVEIGLRRPKVGDFARLRSELTHLRGWWHNRVARTLLVFLLSSLGSGIGTYVAGFRIAERLLP